MTWRSWHNCSVLLNFHLLGDRSTYHEAMAQPPDIAPATGRLGVLTPGLGAVASTFIAGVLQARRGAEGPARLGEPDGPHPAGSQGQEGRSRSSRTSCPLAPARRHGVRWHGIPISPTPSRRRRTCGVLDERDIAPISSEMEGIVAMEAVFDQRRGQPPRWQAGQADLDNKYDQAMALMADIENFRVENNCDRLVMVWCGSTEVYQQPSAVHDTVEAFEQGMRDNDANIRRPSSTPTPRSRTACPSPTGRRISRPTSRMLELSDTLGVPIAGKDFKTGQTLMKTILAPGLKAAMLGLRGWFSTNILGNRDGEVLDDPETFKTKEESKLGVLEQHPAARDLSRAVRRHRTTRSGSTITRPVATTRRAGTTSTSSAGWATRCRSRSTSSAATPSWPRPIVLDLALFMDLAPRAGQSGIQEWLSFYFKSPQAAGEGSTPSTTSSSSRRSSRTPCANGWAKSRSPIQKQAERSENLRAATHGLPRGWLIRQLDQATVPGSFGPGAGAFRSRARPRWSAWMMAGG